MYAKTLIAARPPVPGLVGTTLNAVVLLPQLLKRGWAVFGGPPSRRPVGELVIDADRLQVVVDGQVLLDDTNAIGPAGWWPAVDALDGAVWSSSAADTDVNLTGGTLGQQLTALKNAGQGAVYAALPVRIELPE